MYTQDKEHAFKKFNSDLKNDNFNNIILFYGEEDYLIKWAQSSLINRVIEDSALNTDYVKLSYDASAYDIIQECETFSMFMGKRIIVCENYPLLINDKSKSELEELSTYLKSINPNSYLVFKSNEVNEKSALFTFIKSFGEIYNFTKLDESTLSAFVYKEFKKQQVEISKQLINYFINQTGYYNKNSEYRLYNVFNDITKISAYSDGNNITKEDIDNVLIGDIDTFIFGFLDAISNNRKEVAFKMLEEILKDSNIYSIIGFLINQFELNLEVLELKEKGNNLSQIVALLKVHEYRIKQALKTSEKIGMSKIRQTLSSLYEIDRNIKFGLLDGKTSLELILAKL